MVFVTDKMRREWLAITPEEKRDAIAGGILVMLLLPLILIVIELIGG